MNTPKNDLRTMQLYSILLLTVLIAASAQAQTRGSAANDSRGKATPALAFMSHLKFSLMPAPTPVTRARTYAVAGSHTMVIPMAGGPNLQVLGAGTLGRLTKWTGFTGSNSVIGDSSIFEDKFGNVGIGTDSPTSRLTVAGMIETTLGGLKFPDGTLQTTSAAGALFSVAHDETLQGNGTAGSPLGIAIPLTVIGSGSQLLTVSNNKPSGFGIAGFGGISGTGVGGVGGVGDTFPGGTGILGRGGNSNSIAGGTGVKADGGFSSSGDGGDGLLAAGGGTLTGIAGTGLTAMGGSRATGIVTDKAGIGVVAMGGLGMNGNVNGLAGFFSGDVSVSDNLSKGGGSFKIDHPLDPENKYLYHSFVESPDMKNIYDGVIRLDANGEAIVAMPEWFSALNRDFRYLVTPLGAPMPGLYIAEELQDNRFRVAGGQPGMKVSWQVTGIRQDAYANKKRIKVEEDKSEQERGYYLHPEAFNQPEEKNILFVQHPEIMRQVKEARERQVEGLKQKSQGKER